MDPTAQTRLFVSDIVWTLSRRVEVLIRGNRPSGSMLQVASIRLHEGLHISVKAAIINIFILKNGSNDS